MARLITDEMLDTLAVSGTYDDIGKKLHERYAGLLDRISFDQPYEEAMDDPRHVALVKQLSNQKTSA